MDHKTSGYVDAVCSECQRLVAEGASWNHTLEEYVMRLHPAAGVNIDVGQPNWILAFHPGNHLMCAGTNSIPETTNIR